jgi:hypothetical protein
MREEGVDAGDGLLRILGVYFIFGLAILFRDSQDPQDREGFERVGRLRVEHANTEEEVVPAKNECQRRQRGKQDALRKDARRNHVNFSRSKLQSEQGACSRNLRLFGGADGIRTHDLLDAIEARSQLRHGPTGVSTTGPILHELRGSVHDLED